MEALRGGQLARSSQRFEAFLRELRTAFLERDDVLTQVALALLAREHVLLVGPPGTAKSQLARAVLGRIVDETTGGPSLFARQFTENTVLTDLVGPIDFKTLMETGRSQHFTDEGVIGSVHAFLDEVFDGRDMLLRSTLNLLGEREHKQGKSTVTGRIECSLMTSNRYLTEVLEESRESLLAFVDRIAFVGFVPKGFSNPEPMRLVMRQNLAGGRPALRAYLTIQDLDVLQDACERVRVSPEACDRLVTFLDTFEAEMAAAVRAIPDFLPSRYLSIRTRVRVGKLLKSIAVYRKVVESPERPLEVVPDDFEYLRLALLQSGPPDELLERVASEQDPREARQLKLIKVERDVFRRCLARLDRSPFRAVAVEPVSLEPETWRSASLPALLELLDRATDAGTTDTAMLSRAILARVIEQGLSIAEPGRDELEVHGALLNELERSRGPVDPLVRFLRTRGVALLESAVERELLGLEALSERRAARGVTETVERLGPVVDRLQGFVEEAERVRQSGPQLTFERLRELVHAAASAMISRLREAFLVEARTFEAQEWSPASEGGVRLRAALEAAHGFEARLSALYPGFAPLLEGVVAPAVAPIAARALAPLRAAPRHELMARFDIIWAGLSQAQLARHLPLGSVLSTVLGLAAEEDRGSADRARFSPRAGFTAAGHDELRRAVPRSLLCFVAVQLSLRLDPECVKEFAKDPRLDLFAKHVAGLPAALRQELHDQDLARLRSWSEFLRGWLEHASATGIPESESFALIRVLEREGAATRIRLETELVAALLPDAKPECERLRAEVQATVQGAAALVEARSRAS
ncbi:MAG: putative 2-component regulator [Polyangiaceae bacterium]|nr:putative 2-component regulator [Polyangiaceae bacterium]